MTWGLELDLAGKSRPPVLSGTCREEKGRRTRKTYLEVELGVGVLDEADEVGQLYSIAVSHCLSITKEKKERNDVRAPGQSSSLLPSPSWCRCRTSWCGGCDMGWKCGCSWCSCVQRK